MHHRRFHRFPDHAYANRNHSGTCHGDYSKYRAGNRSRKKESGITIYWQHHNAVYDSVNNSDSDSSAACESCYHDNVHCHNPCTWLRSFGLPGSLLYRRIHSHTVYGQQHCKWRIGYTRRRSVPERIYIWDCIFAGIHFSFSGYFCACGKSGLSFLHNILSIVLVRIPGVYLTSKLFSSTLLPMGLATAAGSLLSVVICVIAFAVVNHRVSSTGQ